MLDFYVFPYRAKYAATAKLARCELYEWLIARPVASIFIFIFQNQPVTCELVYRSNYYMEHNILSKDNFSLLWNISCLTLYFPILLYPSLCYTRRNNSYTSIFYLISTINQSCEFILV